MSSVEAVNKAVACLRVLVHGVHGRANSAELNTLVGKLVNAFLETRWVWPRQFSQETPSAFILTDPRVTELDKVALQSLSRELQLKLFGDSPTGEVSLLVFEGDELEVHRFAGLAPEVLEKLAAGEETFPPFEGQLCRVTPTTSAPVAPAKARMDEPGWHEPIRDVTFSTPKFERNYEPVYRPIYFIPSRRFFGNLALCKPLGSATLRDQLSGPGVLPGVSTEEFDEGCVESAAAAMSQAPTDGLLYVPLNFSSLVRPASREAYSEFLSRLPTAHRSKLVASVYETPRDPSFFALSQVRKFLDTNFCQINLLVADPSFEIEKLAPGVVGSVTLVLPEHDVAARLHAIRMFMRNRETFKRKHIWPGVARVTSRGELDACLAMRVPAVNGPAVADLMTSPISGVQREFENLPLREPGARHGPRLAAVLTA